MFVFLRTCVLTFVVDLKADGSDALVRLQVEPHLVGHADNQVGYEAPRQTATQERR